MVARGRGVEGGICARLCVCVCVCVCVYVRDSLFHYNCVSFYYVFVRVGMFLVRVYIFTIMAFDYVCVLPQYLVNSLLLVKENI